MGSVSKSLIDRLSHAALNREEIVSNQYDAVGPSKGQKQGMVSLRDQPTSTALLPGMLPAVWRGVRGASDSAHDTFAAKLFDDRPRRFHGYGCSDYPKTMSSEVFR